MEEKGDLRNLWPAGTHRPDGPLRVVADWQGQAGETVAVSAAASAVGSRLRELCPRGIDLYFDNMGGPTLDAVLDLINDFGRIVAWGDDLGEQSGRRIYLPAHAQHRDPAGAHAGHCLPRPPQVRPQAYQDLIRWHQEAKIKYRVDVVEGLENAVKAVN
jgi:NADPH-dependent curcumin reductase CurA